MRERAEGGQQKSEAGQLESLLEGVTGSEQRRKRAAGVRVEEGKKEKKRRGEGGGK